MLIYHFSVITNTLKLFQKEQIEPNNLFSILCMQKKTRTPNTYIVYANSLYTQRIIEEVKYDIAEK